MDRSDKSNMPNEDSALKGNARSAPHRLQFALQRLIHVLSTTFHLPLIFAGEDAHLADPTSLELLQGFVTDPHNTNLMLLWTYRNDLVSPNNPLKQSIAHCESVPTLTTIRMTSSVSPNIWVTFEKCTRFEV